MVQASTFIFEIIITILVSISLVSSEPDILNFIKCLQTHTNESQILESVHTPNNASFNSKLHAYVKNRRFLTSKTPKPLAIIAAKYISHIQAAVVCAKSNGLQLRIRSGGHVYEGLSYTSDVPFVILDMSDYRYIWVDPYGFTANVQAGATLGELYYEILIKSDDGIGFPAGVCHSLGVGGHFSGGGYGNLMRKYGLSVDNIFDASIVDVNGNLLNRSSMGEDLFWAIRGGGGASFGVIVGWTLELVTVPQVTVFRVSRSLDQGATDIVYRWQHVAPRLENNLFIRAMPKVVNGNKTSEKTVEVFFIGMFLGTIDELLGIMNKSFPELGLKGQDCKDMRWIDSILFWEEYPEGTPVETLLERPKQASVYSKMRSDYVKNVIPKSGLEAIWKWMIQYNLDWMQWNPYGGKMSNISESDTPFPHRAGNLFLIQYASIWQDEGESDERMEMSRKMYEAMAPYVSRNPREAFLNYRDNGIGTNPSNFTDFKKGQVYGRKYFKNNFEMLAKIKAKVDPDNFFKHEQSIPPLFST
ncbi:FAD-binding Berberine family protein [Euphorbia peplus]|nr:FAD-binding Berberine family protein [Euphorbia peplus]